MGSLVPGGGRKGEPATTVSLPFVALMLNTVIPAAFGQHPSATIRKRPVGSTSTESGEFIAEVNGDPEIKVSTPLAALMVYA